MAWIWICLTNLEHYSMFFRIPFTYSNPRWSNANYTPTNHQWEPVPQ